MDIQNKSILAKLLAAENVTLKHRNVPTASFDLKSRTLTLPIWEEMSVDLYDLFIGHEVGHALFTPMMGWHDNVMEYGPAFKSFLNVIEDARIERKIKSKFPGLVRSFHRGYSELFEKDFFGVTQRDISTLGLIDRINLHFKIGGLLGVPFSETEQQYIPRIEAAESWEDVVVIAEELFDEAKTLAMLLVTRSLNQILNQAVKAKMILSLLSKKHLSKNLHQAALQISMLRKTMVLKIQYLRLTLRSVKMKAR